MHQRPSAVGMTAGHHEPGSTARHFQPEGLTAPRSRAYVCTTMGPTEGEAYLRICRKSADGARSMPIHQARPRSWRVGAVPATPAPGLLLTWVSKHPARVVVIGCHYDGEASSTQSAFDDASGCAIELGVAQAMAESWRSRGLYPTRTLRFVIFDAEEEGILGSFNYVNEAANGSVPDIVAMFNEEQSGIGYPVRFLGKLANPLMPMHLFLSPTAPNGLYPTRSLSAAQAARNQAFAAVVKKAPAGSFRALRPLGQRGLA